MNIPQLNRLQEWKKIILQIKGLEAPDRRPLYKYRLTTREFTLLEEAIVNWVLDFRQSNDFSRISSHPGFADLFVLYCAEWWRRRYDGEGFRWEPIFADLKIPPTTFTPQERSRCVEKGLASWGLSLTKTGGHTYIGSVASQGGLPMQLLASARGGIGALISRVLRHAKTTSVSTPHLEGWVESLAHLLPKSFRQPAIFTLVADITWTVLHLKEKAALSTESNPITQLDQTIPDWRDRFPLPIEDNHAQALIEQLMTEAAKIRPEPRSLAFRTERTLENVDNVWTLRSAVDLPEILNEKELCELFELNGPDLPRMAELTIFAGGSLSSTTLRRFVGRDAFRLSSISGEFSGGDSTAEHFMRLASPDGRTWTASPPKGFAFDNELPWLFAEDGSRFRYARQGSGSVSTRTALAAIPTNWAINLVDQKSEAHYLGAIEGVARSLYSFHGIVHADDGLGSVYKLRTGNAAAGTEEIYEWAGRRIWYELRNPAIAFREAPTLYIVDEAGSKRKAPGDLKYTAVGTKESASVGPIEIRYPATGEIKHRSRMLILPELSNLRIEPIDSRSGKIILDGWRACSVSTTTADVSSDYVKVDGTVFVDVAVGEGVRTPEAVDLKVFWNHTSVPVEVRVPFPVEGVRGFDNNGFELPSSHQVAAQELLGIRLRVQGSQAGRKVRLKLKAADRDIERTHRIECTPGSLSTEIRVADYRREIDHLHTIDDNPDSTVLLTVEVDDETKYRLTILPYQVRPQRDDHQFWIESSSNRSGEVIWDDVQALAIALERPGEEPQLLQKIGSDESGRILWNFFPEDRGDGSWLIFPPKDAAVQFRPTLWTVGDESESENSYARATSLRARRERENALDEFIESVASDFEHPGWIEINQLANQVGHLPLSNLDIWRRFVRSSKAMAALAFRYNNFRGDFLTRFDNELPFSWDAVAFVHWKGAAVQLKHQIENLFPPEQRSITFRTYLKSRVADLTADFGSLFFLFGIVQAAYFEEERQQALGVRNFLGPQAESRLFKGGDSYLNRLRTRQDINSRWPAGLADTAASMKTDPIVSRYLCNQELGNKAQTSVVNLPLILAAQVATASNHDWFSNAEMLSHLNEYKAFAPEWFDDAFNETIARCLADGLFD